MKPFAPSIAKPTATDRAEPQPESRCAASAQIAAECDDVLVRAARSGDRAAFGRLYQRHAAMAHAVALSQCGPADAADLVHDAFAQALDCLQLLRDDHAFAAWLASIVRNRAIEMRRRQGVRRAEVLDHQTAPAPINEQGKHDAARTHALRLMDAIRELPETYAETLTLRLVEGLTGPQIAACTGMTHGSVRVNLNRGMSLLHKKLREMNLSVEDLP